MTCVCKNVAALPALGLTALALVLGVVALANGSVLSPVAEMPRPADAQIVASQVIAPVTTSRDWTEVDGTLGTRRVR